MESICTNTSTMSYNKAQMVHPLFLGESEIEDWRNYLKIGDKIPNLICTIKHMIIKIPCGVPFKSGSIPWKEGNIPSIPSLGTFL